jgi:hypothetical protein
MDAGGTPTGMWAVDCAGSRQSRATPGAVAEGRGEGKPLKNRPSSSTARSRRGLPPPSLEACPSPTGRRDRVATGVHCLLFSSVKPAMGSTAWLDIKNRDQ